MRHKTIGPRGGVTVEEVSCYTCVCFPRCTLLTSTKDFGCGDWASPDGRRVYWGTPSESPADLPSRPLTADCAGCDKCADMMEPPPLPAYHDDGMDSARKLQREFNKLQSARMDHVREEIESERMAPPGDEPGEEEL